MQDRPTAAELLDALGDFMRGRAEHARDRWERFQFQVASNSLGIIRRELEMEDGFMRAEWRGLDELLGPERLPEHPSALAARLTERNAALAGQIRAGAFDCEAEDRLVAHLWETVVNKVAIASPNEKP